MPFGHSGVKQPKPWFADTTPWPFWGGAGHGKTIAVGFPQHVLNAGNHRLGFNVEMTANVRANVGGGPHGGYTAQTVGGVLNASAAQIASAPAFAKNNLYD